MAKDGVYKALENVEMTYSDIVEIANDMTKDILAPTDDLVSEINHNLSALTVESIRDYIIRLQLRAYELSEIRERSALKAQCAEALKAEKHAKAFNAAEGSAAVKTNIALIESSEEIVVEALYEYIAGLFKTKLDQQHRLVAALQSVLISKMQEVKLSINSID